MKRVKTIGSCDIKKRKPNLSSLQCSNGPTNTYTLSSPIGDLKLVSCARGVHSLSLHDVDDKNFSPDISREVSLTFQLYEDNGYTYKPALDSIKWLKSYFTAANNHVLPLPDLCMLRDEERTSSMFTFRVWQQLVNNVGMGETISYQELATLAGSDKASRAVGQAMRNNPVIIMVPCHRCILSSGKVGNYSGGRVNSVKHWLLKHETPRTD